MEKFSAELFYNIGVLLAQAMEFSEPPRTGPVPYEKQMEILRRTLAVMEKSCSRISLALSVKAIKRAIERLSRSPSQEIIKEMLGEIDQRITDEMEDNLFMFIPQDRAVFYDSKELFGAEVNATFPELQFDIVEAGNCFASGRGTAAIFHLMRIMEVGVQKLGDTLGVVLVAEKNWQNILDEINKKISVLPKNPKRVELSQAAANLYAVKLAWRNEVMHPKETYTLEEAENLIIQVRISVQQLSRIR